MSGKTLARVVAMSLFLVAIGIAAEDIQKQKLDRLYQAAAADFEAHRYVQAEEKLNQLLPYTPESFAVHEMLGLVCAALSEDDKAIDHLKKAVQLQPETAAARTNLAASLLRAGKSALAGEQFRKALVLEPDSYDANHNLGEYCIGQEKIADAEPLLEHAQRIRPNYDNGYDLAMADFLLGRLGEARTVALSLLKLKETGELHNLLGQIDEKDGKFVAAAKDYETAAHLDPSDSNLFDWGSEMLLHRTYEPAIAIFQEGVRRYPNSARLLIGLGLSLYSRGKYDDAVKALLSAADLNPADSRPYEFLARAYDSSPNQADAVILAFKRYAELQPGSARAQYYYAMSLWKGNRAGGSGLDLGTVEALLQKAIGLDDTLADAHVQLGNLYADQHNYEKSIPQYVRALELNPNLADAHYRLGTDYVHMGQKESAQQHFAIYQKLRAEHLEEVDKERAEVQQFVYSAKSSGESKR